MERNIKVNLYFNKAGDLRWSVSQVFPPSPITNGHETVLRQNFTTQESAQRYADRVKRVGFEYA